MTQSRVMQSRGDHEGDKNKHHLELAVTFFDRCWRLSDATGLAQRRHGLARLHLDARLVNTNVGKYDERLPRCAATVRSHHLYWATSLLTH